MRCAALALPIVLTGCFAAYKPSLGTMSAAKTGCPEGQLVIEELSSPIGLAWVATGCDRAWECLWTSSQYSSRADCDETPASAARTELRVATDRLQLETNCPVEQVKLIRQAEWRRGSETAYRFDACGRTYVCTAAAGRTDCKPALGE